MARRAAPKQARPRRGAKAAATAADDLAVLFPDRDIEVGGRTVTVRELRFQEQIRHNAVLAPLADAFADIAPDVLASGEGVNRVWDVLAAHWGGVRTLVAASVDQSVEWVESLSGPDGEALVLTWWSVNQGFFLRRLLRPTLVRRAMQQAGAASLPSSSAPDTAPTPSPDTPPGS